MTINIQVNDLYGTRLRTRDRDHELQTERDKKTSSVSHVLDQPSGQLHIEFSADDSTSSGPGVEIHYAVDGDDLNCSVVSNNWDIIAHRGLRLQHEGTGENLTVRHDGSPTFSERMSGGQYFLPKRFHYKCPADGTLTVTTGAGEMV